MIYGLLAEFATAEELLRAAHRVAEEGYRDADAYTPFPVDGLPEALRLKPDRVALATLIGGMIGTATALLLQFGLNGVNYPLNVGGRPLGSWIAFIPVTFELTVLFSGLTAFFSMLIANRLPKPYHPVFNVPRFRQAAHERFYLLIRGEEYEANPERAGSLLASLSPAGLFEVPR